MRTILRRLVYELGFDPKPGTFLYSPYEHYRRAYLETVKVVGLPTVLDEAPKITFKAKPQEYDYLYAHMHYCLVCGSELKIYAADIKDCPRNCGKTHADFDAAHLPIIMFVPSDLLT